MYVRYELAGINPFSYRQILSQCGVWKTMDPATVRLVKNTVKKLSLKASVTGEITEKDMDEYNIPGSVREDEDFMEALTQRVKNSLSAKLMPVSDSKNRKKRVRKAIDDRVLSHRRAVWTNNAKVIEARTLKRAQVVEARERKALEKLQAAQEREEKKERDRQAKLESDAMKARAKEKKVTEAKELKELRSQVKLMKSQLKTVDSVVDICTSGKVCGFCHIKLRGAGNEWQGCSQGCEMWYCKTCSAHKGLLDLHESVCSGNTLMLQLKVTLNKSSDDSNE